MKTRFKEIGPGKPCYIIAEISHNHQGSGEKAIQLIHEACKAGASAVKFQKRDNKSLFSKEFYNSSYSTENSFGKSYGEHREFLEPRKEWLKEANDLAHKNNVDFIMTCFDLPSLKFCEESLNVDVYKIQSADLTFFPLLEAVAKTQKPYIVSTGAATLEEIKDSYAFCKSLNTPFCFLYAVSAYPTSAENCNLSRITHLKKALSTNNIGFSCHYPGIKPAVYSRLLGATVIEKHFTQDKNQKGPDHRISITPDELKQLVEEVREADVFTGKEWEKENQVESYQSSSRYKMGKSPVAAIDLKPGSVVSKENVVFKSPAKGISVARFEELIGKPLKVEVNKGDLILPEFF